MPFVPGFTLRFFEFSLAVAVVDRSRVGPETNVHAGIARACTCERTTITVIDGRPCALGSASAIIFLFLTFVNYSLVSRLERLECRFKFQRASRLKKRRGPANCHEEGHNKWLLILWIIQMIPEHGNSFSSLLCHYALLVFVVVFFFFSIIVYHGFGQIAIFLVSVARDRLTG